MRIRIMLALAGMVAMGTVAAGATFPGAISRDSMIEVENMSRLSVGVDYQYIKRDIVPDTWSLFGLSDVMEAQAVDGFVAVDITPWLSPFITVGASSVKADEYGEDGDYGMKWSAGISWNLWQYEVRNPSWMAGRMYIKSVAEYASYQSDNVSMQGDEAEWTDVTVTLPICYEVFEDLSPMQDKSLRTSLCLYVGPAFSNLEGTYKGWEGDVDFEGDSDFGLIGGVDIFLAESVSIGAQVLVLGEVSAGASLRYHF